MPRVPASSSPSQAASPTACRSPCCAAPAAQQPPAHPPPPPPPLPSSVRCSEAACVSQGAPMVDSSDSDDREPDTDQATPVPREPPTPPVAPADAPPPSGATAPALAPPEGALSPRPPPPADPTTVDQVRAVQRSNLTSEEKMAQIRTLLQKRVQDALAARCTTAPTAALGIFPGRGAPEGCEHYRRKCWIKAECCGKYYPCRRCHDDAEDHELDRRATKTVACTSCGDANQPVGPSCTKCGARFAAYFCGECRLWNDDPERPAYHCAKCGICRAGRGLGVDNYHCDKCNMCMPLDVKDTHPCRSHNLDVNCPICNVHLGTSTEASYVLNCKHAIHVACLSEYLKKGNWTCPLCYKSIPDKATMSKWFRAIDGRVAAEAAQIPEEIRGRRSEVYCNDCETKTIAPFHWRYHKCKDCDGYNTRLLRVIDPPAPQGDVLTEIDRAIDNATASAGASASASASASTAVAATATAALPAATAVALPAATAVAAWESSSASQER